MNAMIPSDAQALKQQFPNGEIKCHRCQCKRLQARVDHIDCRVYVQCLNCSEPLVIIRVEKEAKQ